MERKAKLVWWLLVYANEEGLRLDYIRRWNEQDKLLWLYVGFLLNQLGEYLEKYLV